KFGMTAHHRNSVHDPCHRLLVGVDVGSGDVAIRADDGSDFKSITTPQPLKLVLGHSFGITNDSAFAATVRDAHRGAFPGHPRCESFNFIERDLRVITNPTLRGSTGDVVLNAIA